MDPGADALLPGHGYRRGALGDVPCGTGSLAVLVNGETATRSPTTPVAPQCPQARHACLPRPRGRTITVSTKSEHLTPGPDHRDREALSLFPWSSRWLLRLISLAKGTVPHAAQVTEAQGDGGEVGMSRPARSHLRTRRARAV